MPPALRIDNLWKSYSAGVRGCSVRVWVLRGCTFHVELGERVAIVGARGSGKSTLLQCIAGTRRADAGHIGIVLPVRCCFPAGLGPSDMTPRVTSPALQLVDTPYSGGDERDWRGASLIASRDVASVFHLVDRVLLLRDGRLAPLARAAVRRVAERSPILSSDAVVR